MFDTREKPRMVESAFLIGAYFDRSGEAEARSLLEELAELVGTLGIGIAGSSCVFVRDRNKRYLTGSGKAHELIEQAKQAGADCIVIDNELAPAQQRAWEEEGDITVIDREEVILDIFRMRARTREARLQVDLARMQYSLPRLARMWSHLDRQRGGGAGGGGASRGEGEQQIEVDRRLARSRIDRIREELDEVRRIRQTQRKQRTDEGVCQASIVGYTNAGKSSLLNRLAGSDVLAEDKLFATLDPTTRRIELPDGQTLLLTDTVGFVRNLPHRLVEAFKATLEEAVLADFLIHVLDASATEVSSFHDTTLSVLRELGAADKPIITVLNKIDRIAGEEERLHELKRRFDRNAVLISVRTGEGIPDLVNRIADHMIDRIARLRLRLPQARQDLIALLHREGKVIATEYEGNDVLLTAMVPHLLRHHFEPFREPDAGVGRE